MGKKTSKGTVALDSSTSGARSFIASAHLDPALTSLFAASFGPVQIRQAVSTARTETNPPTKPEEREDNEETTSEASEADSDVEGSPVGFRQSPSDTDEDGKEDLNTPPRKRRKVKEVDDLEARYLNRLAREEARENGSNEKPKTLGSEGQNSESDGSEAVDTADEHEVPRHESITGGDAAAERELAKRTVFLGNVSVEAIKSKSARKVLDNHLSSFISDLPEQKPPHKVESLRFRSTAYADAGLPKKAAYAKKELMEATTKSTNAYVVYSTEIAARKAARLLNGTVVLQRHLRADHVAYPSPVDHKRCVFVGNLGFVDEETIDNEDGDNGKLRKKKAAGDVEEGLWQTFGKAGLVESVRVVRDKVTRVGKGFAYVQFKDENSVEAALLYNEKKFPPLLPRKLRVVRAKKMSKSVRRERASFREQTGPRRSEVKSRKEKRPGSDRGPKRILDEIKKPETFVFEGHRASRASADKLKARSKKSGKRPDNRSTRRAAAFRATGPKRKRSSAD
ncbi:putative nucleolar protein 12 [Phaeomoniella chlamydospora]|uniref:Nucleolar protein 12 n=1 Tax=Phaeomoniella chlamydospora TaxID=158046 RepID=A0A0G2E5Y6_PHACM|nr:putative nucleolar protein 12 [Phaeomoniella chlamydospora]